MTWLLIAWIAVLHLAWAMYSSRIQRVMYPSEPRSTAVVAFVINLLLAPISMVIAFFITRDS